MATPYGLIANLEHRRAQFFLDAVHDAGLPRPKLLSWLDLLRDPRTLDHLSGCALVRVDSTGEHAGVFAHLARRGAIGPINRLPDHGEIAYGRAHHKGLLDVLHTLDRSGLRFTNAAADIGVMSNKWETDQVLRRAGVARPDAVALGPLLPEDTTDPIDIVDSVALGHRLFLKPWHGSSGSGVCAWWKHRGGHRLIAPIEIERRPAGTRLYNSRRVRAYHDRADLRVILGHLLAEGMVAERWLPKATLAGRGCDLRIVTIAGEARHQVLRTGRHPMTNLHLGNQRGDLDRFRRIHGSEALLEAQRAAERAAACFPNSLIIGVDVLLDPDHRAHVLELNAFGDLLPGVVSRGESTYEAAVAAMQVQAAHAGV